MTPTVLRNVLFYVFKFTNWCIIILKFFGNILELVFITYLFFLQNYIFGICFSTISIKLVFFNWCSFVCFFVCFYVSFVLFDILVFLASSQISVFSFGVFGNIL